MKFYKTIIVLFLFAFTFSNASAQRYQGETTTGYGIALSSSDAAQFYVETIHGLRFSENFYAGIGFGYNNEIKRDWYSNRKYWEDYFTAFLNFRCYFPIEKAPRVSLFASMSGGYVVNMDYYDIDGYSLAPALGICINLRQLSAINISVGYDFQQWTAVYGRDKDRYNNNVIALKIGYVF